MQPTEEGIDYGEEPLRKRLVSTGIHKADWEVLPTALQSKVKLAARGAFVLERAIADATVRDGAQARAQARAQAFLAAFNRWFLDTERKRTSYAYRGLRADRGSLAHRAFVALRDELTAVKAARRRSRGSLYDREWQRKAAEQINAAMEDATLLSVSAVCRPEHIEALALGRPGTVAAKLLKLAYPDVVEDELLRAGPKRRA